MKAKISYFLFLILLYVFMFNPPLALVVGSLNLSYVLIVFSLFYVLLHRNRLNLYLKPFKTEICLFVIVVVFSALRSGIEKDYMYIVRHVLPFLYIVAVIPCTIMLAKKVGIHSETQFIRSIFIVSAVASCITILCVLFPGLDEFVRNRLIQYDEDSYLFGNIRRGFGIASGLTSYYGYILGVIVGICPLYMKGNKWFASFIPLIILSILVNARTGVLIALWGVSVFFFTNSKQSVLPIFALILLLYFYLVDIMLILHFNPETIAWIQDFIDQIMDISSGNLSEGTANTLLDSMNVWPSNALEWLIGKGVLMYHAALVGDTRTDIGWLLQLSYGGLVYIFILYYIFIYMANRLVKNREKILMWIFAGSIIIINTKSKIFPTTGVFTVLMLMYFICILNKFGLWGKSTPNMIERHK